MKVRRVDGSSHIRAAGYDPRSRTLRVVYASAAYDYVDVPPEVFEGIGRAGSPGRYCRAALEPYEARAYVGPLTWDETPWP